MLTPPSKSSLIFLWILSIRYIVLCKKYVFIGFLGHARFHTGDSMVRNRHDPHTELTRWPPTNFVPRFPAAFPRKYSLMPINWVSSPSLYSVRLPVHRKSRSLRKT